jgi:hypothetical protein
MMITMCASGAVLAATVPHGPDPPPPPPPAGVVTVANVELVAFALTPAGNLGALSAGDPAACAAPSRV